jgi:hypothetical protein
MASVKVYGRQTWEVARLYFLDIPDQVEGLTFKYGGAPEDKMPILRIMLVPGLVEIQEIHKGRERQLGVNPKTATASQGNKYIEWSEEWICPELFTVAI